MSKAIRPTIAALIGAAALATTAPASAEPSRQPHRIRAERPANVRTPDRTAQDATVCEAPAPTSLRAIIEHRAEKAVRVGRHGDLDELTTLWLTLERRDQLDRVVERGEQFVNVSLRNQKRSQQRVQGRALRRYAPDPTELDLPRFSLDVDQALDAEAFVASLDEPHRSAVKWSLNGMNHRAVAEQMGASHAAVRKWAQRLRERLNKDDSELHLNV